MKTIKITEGVHYLINQWKARNKKKTISDAILDIYLEWSTLKQQKVKNYENEK